VVERLLKREHYDPIDRRPVEKNRFEGVIFELFPGLFVGFLLVGLLDLGGLVTDFADAILELFLVVCCS